MALFKDMLKADETLFRDEIALDYEFLPKLLPYREKEQFHIANCIKPLFQKRNGKNIFIHGAPGIGKTAATRHVIRDLENETDEIVPFYINCWKKNTPHKIILEMCEIIGYRFVQNKTTEELFDAVKKELNKSSAVFVFDEVDKLDDINFLYSVLEDIFRKTIIIITNYKSWIANLDPRIKSRLTAEMIEFKPYNPEETKGILKKRLSYAFQPNVWDDAAFETVAKKAGKLGDVRAGLYLLRESAIAAEEESSKKITKEHVEKAIDKFDQFYINNSDDLEQETLKILELIKDNNGQKIGNLFDVYKKNGGSLAYSSFKRRIKKLEEGKFISVDKTEGGDEGNTTIIRLKEKPKKLTDF